MIERSQTFCNDLLCHVGQKYGSSQSRDLSTLLRGWRYTACRQAIKDDVRRTTKALPASDGLDAFKAQSQNLSSSKIILYFELKSLQRPTMMGSIASSRQCKVTETLGIYGRCNH